MPWLGVEGPWPSNSIVMAYYYIEMDNSFYFSCSVFPYYFSRSFFEHKCVYTLSVMCSSLHELKELISRIFWNSAIVKKIESEKVAVC